MKMLGLMISSLFALGSVAVAAIAWFWDWPLGMLRSVVPDLPVIGWLVRVGGSILYLVVVTYIAYSWTINCIIAWKKRGIPS